VQDQATHLDLRTVDPVHDTHLAAACRALGDR
jgi:hypothetical protein